jgi:uncharacterized protein
MRAGSAMRLNRNIGPLRLVTLAPAAPASAQRHDLWPAVFRRLMQLVFATPLSRDGFRLRWPAIAAEATPADFESLLGIARTENRRGVPVTIEMLMDAARIDAEWIALFRRHDVKLELRLDGPAALHNHHRRDAPGLASFATARRAIARLRAAGYPFDVCAWVTHRSFTHAQQLLPLFADLGARSVGFETACEGCAANDPCERDETWDAFWRELVLSAGSLSREMPVREVGEALLRLAGDLGEMQDRFVPLRFLTCDGVGNLSTFSPGLLGVDAPLRDKFVFGTVNRLERLEDMLANIALRRTRDDIAAGVAACEASCDYFAVCGGGEPAQKLREHGSLRASETRHCRRWIQAPARLTMAMAAALSEEPSAAEAGPLSP